MATLEERVAYLEGRVGEQAQSIDGVRAAVLQLDHRVDALDHRIDALERRVQAFEERVDRRFEGVERRLDGLDDKATRYFVWVVGIQVTTLAAIVAALVTR